MNEETQTTDTLNEPFSQKVQFLASQDMSFSPKQENLLAQLSNYDVPLENLSSMYSIETTLKNFESILTNSDSILNGESTR
jgi:hypothetical protein